MKRLFIFFYSNHIMDLFGLIYAVFLVFLGFGFLVGGLGVVLFFNLIFLVFFLGFVFVCIFLLYILLNFYFVVVV